MLNPVFFVWGVLAIIIFLSVVAICSDNGTRAFVNQNYKYLILVLVISITSIFAFDNKFFYGLEYEDAFIFTEYSRYLIYNFTFSHDPFQTKGCMLGSLNNCLSEGTYGGHLLVLSSIGYFFNKCLGYSPQVICFINFFASLVSICLIYCISNVLIDDKRISIISSLIFSLSPAMSLFHTSGLSETLSATSIVLMLFVYLVLIERQKDLNYLTKITLWILLFLTFLICILQKRENLILAFIPSITVARAWLNKQLNRDIILRVTALIGVFTIIVLVYHSNLNVFGIEKEESLEITSATFSTNYFFSLAPIFIKSLFNIKWFFVFSYFVFIGLVIIPLKYRKRSLYLYPLILLIAYFMAYTMHYRSYYFIKYGLIHDFESLRYITNFYPLYSLIAGYAVISIYDAIRVRIKMNRNTVLAFSLILLSYLIYGNISLKKDFYYIEQESRILPIREALRCIEQANSIIITDVPLIFQVFGSESLQLIDLSSLGLKRNQLIFMEIMNRNTNTYYLKNILDDRAHKYERWPEAMRYIDSLPVEQVREYNSSIYALYKVIKNS